MKLTGSGKLLIVGAAGLGALTALRHAWTRVHLPLSFHIWSERVGNVLSTELFQFGNKPVRLLFVLKIAAFLFVLGKFSALARFLLRRLLQSDPRFDFHRIYVLSRLLTIAIFVFGCLIAIHVERISLHTFVLIGGTLGVAIGLGIQRYVGNLIAGVSLLFEAPVRLGDFVQFGSHQGFVERLGTSTSWLRTPDNTTVVIPNTELMNKEILNFTGSHQIFRLAIPISISYGVDPAFVADAISRTVADHPAVLREPQSSAILVRLETATMTFNVRAWTKMTPDNFDVLTSELYLQLIEMFRVKGIRLPRPELDIILKESRMALQP
ncbi:mechanosensitive ion channel family protein [Terriglobus albidus]|uniref:mechanosensitive ion channel family protein n=1 Tax=Terriglobus albidus TaxID=1592106 RepID=UPI0021E09D34|nr:mechanosensitive ion channel domain-containing protein [Terriglobus albidus]